MTSAGAGGQASHDQPEIVLILAPRGRDGTIAGALLDAAGMPSRICPDLASMTAGLRSGAGAALLTEEAVQHADLRELAAWISEQPPWSDFPFVLLIGPGAGNPAAMRWMDLLRNVSLVERPFHPATLVSVLRTALGSRRRQYQSRLLIEAQRITADALRANEEHLRFALVAAQLGAWSFDTKSSTLEASAEYKQLYGRDPNRPMTFDDVQAGIAPADRARVADAVARTLGHDEPYDIEYRVVWPDGSEHWLAARGRMLQDGNLRLVGVATDVTARRNKDDELGRHRERLEDLVAERTRDLERANVQLLRQADEREQSEARLRQSQKMEAVGQLTGGIAHDFNNLLSAIMGSLELISTRTEDPRILRLTTNALTAVTRGARLTKQMLAFSRTQRLDLAPVRLNTLIEGMHELLASSLGGTVAVRFDLAPGVGACLADANQLELAILNLAINSRDAMPDGGTVTITTGVVEAAAGSGNRGMVAVAVSDTGQGMPAEVVDRAFEPFFTTKPVGRGTGLGLSQVYGIARQSGGTATIESAAGRGTTVTILLPSADAGGTVAEAAVGAVWDTAAARERQDTILVVDDDPDVRRFLVESLLTLGYGVAEAAHGKAGLDRLGSDPAPDLMIVDFAMPGMNGAEVAAEALKRLPNLPIVLATGYAETAALVGELSLLPVLRKPFHMAELATAVHGALRRAGHRAQGSGLDPIEAAP